MTLDPTFLEPLYEHDGPYASVVLETDRSAEDAAHAIAVRWRGLRSSLASLGTDAETLSALDEVVGTPSGLSGELGQLVVATAGEVVLDERLYRHPGQGVARWERLPYVWPLLRALADQLPCLVVRVDGAGADIEVRAPGGTYGVEISGDDHPLHKSRKGGWSHRKIQQRVENTARDNVRQVASRVDDLVRKTGVDLILLAGEPRTRSELTNSLSGDAHGLVVDLEGGSRHADGGDVDGQVADVVRSRAHAKATSVAATYYEELSSNRNGVAGLSATLGALQRAQVATVLVEDAPSADAPVWVGADPLALAHQPQDLEALGIAEKYRVPASSALTRAAARSGAGIALADAGATAHRDGVGALLRYVHHPATAHA